MTNKTFKVDSFLEDLLLSGVPAVCEQVVVTGWGGASGVVFLAAPLSHIDVGCPPVLA